MLVFLLVLINSFAVGGDYFFYGPNLCIKELALKADNEYEIFIHNSECPEKPDSFDDVVLNENYCDFNLTPEVNSVCRAEVESIPFWKKFFWASGALVEKQQSVLHSLQVNQLAESSDHAYRVSHVDGYQKVITNGDTYYYTLLAGRLGRENPSVVLRLYDTSKKPLVDHFCFFCAAGSKITNVALNYPYVAYVDHVFQGGKNELIAHHLNDRTADQPSLRLERGLKKMSWLKGKNLLALTTDGKVFVIDVSSVPYIMHEQKIAGCDSIDMMAVDTQSPWRVLLFSTVKGLMYLNFGSAGYIENDAGTTISLLKKKTLTYRIVMPASDLPNAIWRMWFSGNNVAIVSSLGLLKTYKLVERYYLESVM